MKAMFSASNIAAITNNVRDGLHQPQDGDDAAGYTDSQYKILAQTYSAPLPLSVGIRYARDRLHAPDASAAAACGTSDINWARNTVVDTLNSTVKNAVSGHGERAGARHRRRAVRPPAVREHRRRARGEGHLHLAVAGRGRQDRVGAPDPHRHARIFRPTSCRRTGTRTTGASSRCATASARPTTAATRAAGRAPAGTGLNAKGEPNMGLN